MSTGTSALLPMAPAPADPVQATLTATHLGDPDVLRRYFTSLRSAVDPALARQYPTFTGKGYPVGRCLEIRDAVFAVLQERVNAPQADADAVIADFLRRGGSARKIWGVLRDTYFQNAIQLGTWYVDVANDTVVPTKPPVEILPIADADMVAIRDYRHFAAIAEKYWKTTIYRNSVFPRLAAIFPLVCVNAEGAAWLAAASDQVVELTRRHAFQPSLDALAAFPEPPAHGVALLTRLAAREVDSLLDTDGDAVQCVKACIAERRHDDIDYRQRCVAAYRRLRSAVPSV
ncbi:hypothetical protein [Thalassobaculum sp.]|uniref:hypothetical protein n=1 Tax=Thalassobaculum sp. TaxID=2022740 RepID=UPI0032EE498E